MAENATPITFLLGCTAGGKGSAGRALATRIGAEIVSVDSMKVFRRMDIGTAKPSPTKRQLVPHHLIDVAEPSEGFSVAAFVRRAEEAATEIAGRGGHVLAVGGTPLYIKAWSEGLFDGPSADPVIRAELTAQAERLGTDVLHAELAKLDPEAASRIHPNDLRRIVRAIEVHRITGTPISELQTQWDRQRTKHPCTFIGLRRSLEDQNHRTNLRVRRMMEDGLVDEVQRLLDEPTDLSITARQALGYAEVIQHLEEGTPLADAVEMIKINTRRFAKAQRTWFKRFHATSWIDLSPDSAVDEVVDQILAIEGSGWST